MSDDQQKHFGSRHYRRPFARPLKAAWGTWSVREGIILRLKAPTPSTFLEIAPLPPSIPSTPSIPSIPSTPPTPAKARTAALLSLDEETPEAIDRLRDAGFRTFKLKVGMASAADEWGLLQPVVTRLQEGEKLRLDPNRSWDDETWNYWKPRLRGIKDWIEFLEEPFSKGPDADQLLRRTEASPVPLALDESLAEGGLADWVERGWPGYWVIKPTLLGPSHEWLDALREQRGRVVLSSVFETGIGLSRLIRLAQAFPGLDHGLGTQDWFDDDLGVPQEGAELTALDPQQQEELWKRLPAE